MIELHTSPMTAFIKTARRNWKEHVESTGLVRSYNSKTEEGDA
jgi:hypothetical protein